jgi:transposase
MAQEGSPMSAYVVGLDVHKAHTTFVIQDGTGTVSARGEFPTTRVGLEAWSRAHSVPAGTAVALESGTLAFFVAEELQRVGLTAVVLDAHEVRAKARPRQKSDRRDAFELCDGLRRGIYRTVVHVPAPAIRQLRGLLARRRHFVRVQTAQATALKHRLRATGQATLARSLRTPRAWERVQDRVAADPELATLVASHYAVWTAAAGQRALLEHTLAGHAQPLAADLRRLQTVPGVGPLVALTALAAFAEVQRFAGAKQAASYAGLVPSTYQSGACDRHGHITKRGSAELRAMLVEAAHHAARRDHPLHHVFTRLCVRRGYKPAVVAVAHRLCRILFALLRDQTEFTPPLYPAATRGPRRRRGVLAAALT